MKPWRAFLLVLLIGLLPLRGAIAATMLCPPGNHTAVAAAPAEGHAHHHHDAGHASDDSAAKPGPAHGSGCHVCASFCSATPLLAAMPVIQQPEVSLTMSYPTWAAPASLFLSDGQERPPRST